MSQIRKCQRNLRHIGGRVLPEDKRLCSTKGTKSPEAGRQRAEQLIRKEVEKTYSQRRP